MKQPLKLCILGDICPAKGFLAEFAQCDHKQIFGDVLPELQSADVCVANLETPASDHGAPIEKCGAAFCCAPTALQTIKNAGIGYLSLANNHILDYGGQALTDTVAEAEKLGISTFGGGANATDAAKPLFVEKKGWKLGFFSFAEQEFNIAGEHTPGANLFDPYCSLKQITAAKAQCDYFVVLYHGGIEHYALPSPLLQKKCRAMADAGADLVLCQHSHCIGTEEHWNGTTILYGQGNAVFGKRGENEAWNTGLLTTVMLSEEEKTVSYRLLRAEEHGIHFATEEENCARLQKMAEQSAQLSDATYVQAQWDAFCEKKQPMYLPLLFGWNRVTNKLNKLLHNRLAKLRIKKNKARTTMNLIRCDAHREVTQTILEKISK